MLVVACLFFSEEHVLLVLYDICIQYFVRHIYCMLYYCLIYMNMNILHIFSMNTDVYDSRPNFLYSQFDSLGLYSSVCVYIFVLYTCHMIVSDMPETMMNIYT